MQAGALVSIALANSFLHVLFCEFAAALEEQVCDRADGAIFQSHDPNRSAAEWMFDRQNFQFGSPRRKYQSGIRHDRNKPPGREQTCTHLGWSDHGRVGIIKTAIMKGFHGDRAERAIRQRQYPWLAHQLRKLDLAPPRPRILSAHDTRIGIVKERSEVELVVGDRAKPSCDQNIDVAFGQFTVQRPYASGDDTKHHPRIAAGKPINSS